jgi:alanine racemase
MLGVTRVQEAAELRAAGVENPVLVLAPPTEAELAIARDLGVVIAVDRPDLARAAAQIGVPMHLKLDTGMGRLGCLPEHGEDVLAAAGPFAQGVFTHFASAADAGPTGAQIERFRAFLLGRDLLAHACSSTALLRYPEAHFGMVRAGTVLYGQTAVPGLDLRPTWQLFARVISAHTVPAGSAIGYGAECVARRPTRVGVLAIGFADGFTMTPEGPIYRQPLLRFAAKRRARRLAVTIEGRSVPVLGRVSMQLTCIDLTDVPAAGVGSLAEVPALRLATNPAIPRIAE